jgi:hypothetical protein
VAPAILAVVALTGSLAWWSWARREPALQDRTRRRLG